MNYDKFIRKMNENMDICAVNRNNICITCLKTTSVLRVMNSEFAEEYKHFVGHSMRGNPDIHICDVCSWVFQKFFRFKQQCKIAHNILSKIQMDTPIQPLKHYQNLQPTNVEIFAHPENEFDVKEEYSPVHSPLEIAYNTNDTESELTDIKIVTTSDALVKKNEINDCSDQTKFPHNDGKPLVSLRGDEQIVQKRKRYRKKSVSKKKNIVPKVEQVATQNNDDKKKIKKEARDGFSSRMVQERDEYTVIKLTKEQVLNDIEEKVKSEAFQRASYKCKDCGKFFNFPDVLEAHMKKHSEESGTLQCDICSQRCPNVVSFRGHMKSHTTRYKCKLCPRVRASRQHLLDHYAMAHLPAQGGYTCDSCRFHTHKRTIMQRHVKTKHSPPAALACDKCGKLFSNIESLRVHILRHERSSLRKCPQCDKSFVYESLLRRHVVAVHETNAYYCVECDVHFKSSESMSLHFKKAKKHRDSSAQKYACKCCDKRFFTTSSLLVHMSASHSAPKSHVCATCHRSYSNSDALRAHTWKTHQHKHKTRAIKLL